MHPSLTAEPFAPGTRRIVAALLAAAIFGIDTFTALGSAVAVLYVLVLIIIGEGGSRRAILAATAICASLTLFSFSYMHGLHGQLDATLRLLFSLAALTATAFLLLCRTIDRRILESQAEALRRSEQRYRTIFETLAVAIWEHDLRPMKAELDALRARGVTDLPAYLAENPDFVRRMRNSVKIIDVNTTALRMMGVGSKEEFFTSLHEFLEDDVSKFAGFLVALDANAPSWETESTLRTRSGDLLRVIAAFNFPPDGALDRVQASVLNITERVRVQETLQRTRDQLDHALRAAMVGEVSASIAHEINQPLAAISLHADAAARWIDRDPPDLDEVRASIREAAVAARRASEVVRRVRSFMTKVEPDRVPLDLEPLVEEAIRLAQPELAVHAVTLHTAFAAPGTLVRGDRILLQQVLINLMVNAAQAMAGPAMGGSTRPARDIRLVTRRTLRGVVIEVLDTGPGFTPEAAAKAFDPFFSTKANGMGLGLAMCRTIIGAHEGEITIAPVAETGGGGRVIISLPALVAGLAE